MKPGRTGFSRLFHAFGYSWLGLKATFKHEAAFREEVAIAVVLTPLALWLTSDAVELSLLLGSLWLVLIVELLNSGLEAIVDRVGSEHHELSGRAKDMGAAAVALALLNVIMIWGLLLYKYFA